MYKQDKSQESFISGVLQLLAGYLKCKLIFFHTINLYLYIFLVHCLQQPPGKIIFFKFLNACKSGRHPCQRIYTVSYVMKAFIDSTT